MTAIHIQLKGSFKLDIVDSTTQTVSRSLEFDNLILNQGLDRLANNADNNLLGVCVIGTGTSTPTESDVFLSNYSANTNSLFLKSRDKNISSSPNKLIFNVGYSFAQGGLNGNYSEIGVGWAASSGNLFSRTLIKDEFGQPTTITVLSTEILRVTYVFEMIIPNQYASVSPIEITNVSSNINYTVAPYNRNISNTNSAGGNLNYDTSSLSSMGWQFSSYSGVFYKSIELVRTDLTTYSSLAPVDSSSSTVNGTSSTRAPTSSMATYVPGTFYRNCTAVFGLDQANGTNRLLITTFSMFIFQVLFDTPIVKSSSQTLTINFRVSWGRYTP